MDKDRKLEYDRKYNQKRKQYKATFRDNETEITNCIDNSINKSGLSVNNWLKLAIIEKLKRDNEISADYEYKCTK